MILRPLPSRRAAFFFFGPSSPSSASADRWCWSSTDLLVPYSYSESRQLTGVFFDFQQRSKDVLIARFKWVQSPIQGFAYIQRTDLDAASGGWWYAQDVLMEALQDLRKLSPHLPRMNDLNLIRLRRPSRSPQWAIDFFARSPSNASLRRLLWDA